MKHATTVSSVHTIGLDIAKNSFAVHGFDAGGHTVLTKELKRGQVLAFFASLSPCNVGITVTRHSTKISPYTDHLLR